MGNVQSHPIDVGGIIVDANYDQVAGEIVVEVQDMAAQLCGLAPL